MAYVHPKMRTSVPVEQMDSNIVDSMNPARNAKVNGVQSGARSPLRRSDGIEGVR